MAVAEKTDLKNMQLFLKQQFAFQRRLKQPDFMFLILFNFIDALHFAARNESVGLQLADSVAFVIKRHLMAKADSEEFYKLIEPCLVCKPESALWPLPEDRKLD